MNILECERIPFLGEKCPFFLNYKCFYHIVPENVEMAPVREMNRLNLEKMKNDPDVRALLEIALGADNLPECTKIQCPICGKIITEWELME